MQKLATKLLEDTISFLGERPDINKLSAPESNSWSSEFSGLEQILSDAVSLKNSESGGRVCIATEDIVGPIRNGGIGTTYSFLSRLLAENGFDVSILYLRGDHSENGPIDDWVEYYANFGVKFVPVPDHFTNSHVHSDATRWIAPMYNLYTHLLDNHFDLVHVSEWRGSGYLSMLAKKQGIAFQDTKFLVKCSSPWLWNRLYGNHTVNAKIDVLKMYCERRCVELGDHVIGGSAHLLRWMKTQGYQLNHESTFVQPNVVITDDLDEIAKQRSVEFGETVNIEEIVFFGRLESRKGLQVFCEAIQKLVDKGINIPSVSFMGKEGARLESRPDVTILEYIRDTTRNWGVEIKVHTKFQQQEALAYLMTGNRLAVMPSLIENSSLAVYEACICGIPFLASNSGGTPEIMKEEYHESVLFDPHPVPLSHLLEKTLSAGAFVAECAFSNDRNNEIWLKYHRQMLCHTSAGEQASRATDHTETQVSIGFLVYHTGDVGALDYTLKSLLAHTDSGTSVVILDDFSIDTEKSVRESNIFQSRLDRDGWDLVELEGLDRGIAYNHGIEVCSAEYICFLRSGDRINEKTLPYFSKAVTKSSADLFTSFYSTFMLGEDRKSRLCGLETPILGDISTSFYDVNLKDYFLVCRKSIFSECGPFTGDYRVGGEIHEFVNTALMYGFEAEVVPEKLLERPVNENWQLEYNIKAENARTIRPYYQYGPQVYRNALLVAKGLADKNDSFQSRMNALLKHNERLKQKNEESNQALISMRKQVKSTQRHRSMLDRSMPELLERFVSNRREETSDGSTPNLVNAIGNNEALTSLKEIFGSNIDGEILYANESEICGWVLTDPSGSNHSEIILRNNKVNVLVTTSTLNPRDFAHGTDVPNRGGFKFDLSQFNDSIDITEGNFDVITSNGYVIGEFSYNDRHLGHVVGAIDKFALSNQLIRGWIWSPGNPDLYLDIDVYLDGKHLLQYTCNEIQEFRVKRAKDPRLAAHGFTIHLPELPLDGHCHRLIIRVPYCTSAVYSCEKILDTSTGSMTSAEPSALPAKDVA